MDRRKAMVREAYDAIAEAWGRERQAMDDPRERAWLHRFCSELAGERVLEVGCGGGAVLKGLVAQGLHVTGVDFSRAQLALARATCPSALLIQGDLAEIELAPAIFDGVIAYDCLWHLPREDHGAVLARLRRWMVDGAPLLLTVGAAEPDHSGELREEKLCGAPIYYSAWPRDTTFALLRQARLELVDYDQTPERALLLLARAA
jgi:cyclopropane fatty-acyl-phospholipid synthase-like methyltransferase